MIHTTHQGQAALAGQFLGGKPQPQGTNLPDDTVVCRLTDRTELEKSTTPGQLVSGQPAYPPKERQSCATTNSAKCY